MKTSFFIRTIVSCSLLLSLAAFAQSTVDEEETHIALTAEVAVVRRGPVTEIVFAEGNSQAVRKEFLLFENPGKVTFLKSNDEGGSLREGDTVVRGELLAKLDHRIDDATARAARAELDNFRAALTNAETEYERAKSLRDRGAIQISHFEATETAYQQALAEVRAAEARSDQVRASLRQLQIRAPFDGVVAFVNIREGQYVSPGQFSAQTERSLARTSPIVVIDASSFETIVELPVVSGRRVARGQTAYLLDEGTLAHVQEYGYASLGHVDSIDDLLIPGRVVSVSPAIDPNSRSVRARVVTDQNVAALTDGGYVTVWIETERRENAIVAPLDALLFRGELAFVFVVDPTTRLVEQRPVIVGLTGQEGIEITEGLNEGETVVTKGRFRLSSGMRIRPVSDPQAKTQS